MLTLVSTTPDLTDPPHRAPDGDDSATTSNAPWRRRRSGTPFVLIVEDEPQVGTLLQRTVAASGVAGTCVTTLERFVEAFDAHRPELILLDLKLARGDGVDVLAYLARQDFDVPVVLLSGYGKRALESSAQLARALGVRIEGIFTKPLDLPAIRQVIEIHALDRGRAVISAAGGAPGQLQAPSTQLKCALDRGEIVPHYQPKLCVNTGRVIGVEALARWLHPIRGVVEAAGFIELAEGHGLIRRLTMQILNQALADLRRFETECSLTMSINLSPLLLEDHSVADDFESLLREHKVSPSRLILEITEQTPIRNLAVSLETITRICLHGVELSLDDFGIAYASVASLRQLPVSEAKIDHLFVEDLSSSQKSQVIVRALAALGRELGLRVVAEGVRDARAMEILRDLGVALAQGYYFCPPLSGQDLRQWLRQRRS